MMRSPSWPFSTYNFQIINFNSGRACYNRHGFSQPAVSRKKKKPGKFTATIAVKSLAREVLGTPPPVRKKESAKRLKKTKHKPTLGKMISEGE